MMADCDDDFCEYCRNESAIVHEQELIEEFGWVMHSVSDEDLQCPTGYNAHTHGFEMFHHMDVQIILPIDVMVIHNIFSNIFDLIKQGIKFKHGEVADNILLGANVKFIQVIESGRQVLRVILPDVDGNLDEVKMNGLMYKLQCRSNLCPSLN